MKGSITLLFYFNWFFFFNFPLFAADGTKKRKKVISWPFALRRTSTSGDSPGQLDSGLKITLFGQPLAIICGEDDMLPQPVQVSNPSDMFIILLASRVRQDPLWFCYSTLEISGFGVSSPCTILRSSELLPGVEWIRWASSVHSMQLPLEITSSGDIVDREWEK